MGTTRIVLIAAAAIGASVVLAAQQPELTGSVPFVVGSRSGIVQRVAVTVGDGGSGPYKAILAGDPALATHTLYRPRDLSPFGPARRLPIVAWANGGCRSTSGEFRNFLIEVASHGFLVVAIGPAAHSAVMGSEAPVNTSRATQLIDGVDWAIAEHRRQGSEFFQKLEPTKIAVMGQSCGGVQALDVSRDPRVTTTVVWNSGILNRPAAPPAAPAASGQPPSSMVTMTKERLSELHAPVAYFIGGPSDVAHPNAADDFQRINHVPVFMANRNVGHYPATYREPHGGAFGAAGVAWLNWQLKGDAGAARTFVGPNCGLCSDTAWTVQAKNLR